MPDGQAFTGKELWRVVVPSKSKHRKVTACCAKLFASYVRNAGSPCVIESNQHAIHSLRCCPSPVSMRNYTAGEQRIAMAEKVTYVIWKGCGRARFVVKQIIYRRINRRRGTKMCNRTDSYKQHCVSKESVTKTKHT